LPGALGRVPSSMSCALRASASGKIPHLVTCLGDLSHQLKADRPLRNAFLDLRLKVFSFMATRGDDGRPSLDVRESEVEQLYKVEDMYSRLLCAEQPDQHAALRAFRDELRERGESSGLEHAWQQRCPVLAESVVWSTQCPK
jgi:hypothetical protein